MSKDKCNRKDCTVTGRMHRSGYCSSQCEIIDEYEQLFELQCSRMKEAVDIWKAETGAEHEPDLGFLLGWLNGRISALEADNKTMKGVITTLRRERRQA